MMDFFILTTEEEEKARTLHNREHAAVQGRLIDVLDLTLTGKYVLPVRIVEDPDYQFYCPELVKFLKTLPSQSLDPDVVFVKGDPDGL